MHNYLLGLGALFLSVFATAQEDISIVSVDDMSTSLNGTEVVVNGSPSDLTVYKDMRLVNNTNEPKTVYIRRIKLANLGVLDQICYNDMLCVDATGETYIIPSEIVIQPGEDAEFKPQIVPAGDEVCVINKYEITTAFGVVYDDITVKFTSGSADCFLNTANAPIVKEFTVYPNPASTALTISFSSPEKHVLLITDALGNKVIEQNILTESTIAVEDLNNGIYFVQLYNKEGLVDRKKLIVKH
jgi:hypothetical protein